MDRHFISFPKSGRSWLRYALARLGVADRIAFHHDGFEYNDGSRPPLDFDYEARRVRYSHDKRIVYLERDPRDVMVSLYFQVTGRFADFFGYGGAISEFIRDPYFGARNLRLFRDQWAALGASPHVLAVSYEACHTDFPQVLSRIVRHYGFDIQPDAIAEAAVAADFAAMQQVEKSGRFAEPWLRLRNGSPKVRRGKVGSFTDELSAADIDYLDGVFFAPTGSLPKKVP